MVGAVLLAVLRTRIRHFRWQLIISLAAEVIFGALVALVTQTNRATIIALTFLEMAAHGYSVFLCYSYVQQGAEQIELGIAGGLCGVIRFAGASLAQATYSTILSNRQTSQAGKLIPKAVLAAGLPESSLSSFLAAFPKNQTGLREIRGLSTAVLLAAGEAYNAPP